MQSKPIKLKDLPEGAEFILCRSGERYTKGKKYYYPDGKPTKRFICKPECGPDVKYGQPVTLSLQCRVIAVEP